MKVLILGVTGMLGNTAFRHLSSLSGLEVLGTARDRRASGHFAEGLRANILTGINVENHDSLVEAYARARPDVVINCIGVIKQLAAAEDPLATIPVNSLLPHRLAALCAASGSRLVHISTDCVFSGTKGHYTEADIPDANDLYGRSKLLGEVTAPHAMTLRTSLIGHELSGNHSLVNWFLSQDKAVKGYTRAIFSGLPTIEIARIIAEYVLPRPDLSGLYQVAAQPIDKCTLLKLIAQAYRKDIEIIPDDAVRIDRSLDGARFRQASGYVAPDWPELIARMHQFH